MIATFLIFVNFIILGSSIDSNRSSMKDENMKLQKYNGSWSITKEQQMILDVFDNQEFVNDLLNISSYDDDRLVFLVADHVGDAVEKAYNLSKGNELILHTRQNNLTVPQKNIFHVIQKRYKICRHMKENMSYFPYDLKRKNDFLLPYIANKLMHSSRNSSVKCSVKSDELKRLLGSDVEAWHDVVDIEKKLPGFNRFRIRSDVFIKLIIVYMENINDRTNTSSLTSIFDNIKTIKATNEGLSKVMNCTLLTLESKNCIEDFCKSDQKDDISKLICFMIDTTFFTEEDMKDQRRSELESFLHEKIKEFLSSYSHKLDWYSRLKSVYDNSNPWNQTYLTKEIEILQSKAQNPSILEKFMRDSLTTVLSAIAIERMNVSCLPMKNGYNLQVKGKLLKLSRILNRTNCNGYIKIIEIFALEKIVIDEELKSRNGTSLIIIAPVWEIVHPITIDLDGDTFNNNINVRARNGSLDGNQNGENRMPGLPGGPAGSFYGIGKTFIGGENLIITANGGDGSDGQSGGHAVSNTKYLSRGGEGGMGGKGGLKGEIKIFSWNDSSVPAIRISAEDGTDGKPGKGVLDSKKNEEIKKNFIGYKAREEIKIAHRFVRALNDYKKFILSNPLETYNNEYLLLYQELYNNTNIHKTYTTLNYVEELIDLEQNYYEQQDKYKSLDFYKSWKNRFSEYLSRQDEHKKDANNSYNLSGLKDLVEIKISKLKSGVNKLPIRSTKDIVDECIRQRRLLDNAEIVVNLKNISSEFKKEIEKQFEEAQHLLQDELQVDVESKYNKLTSKIVKLLHEIVDFVESKKNDIAKLNEMKDELEDKIKLKNFIGLLQIVSLGLSFIGPIGFAVSGTLAAAGTSIESVNLIDDKSIASREVKIPKAAFESLEASFKTYDLIKGKKQSIIKNETKSIDESTQLVEDVERILQNLSENQAVDLKAVLETKEEEWKDENKSEVKKNEAVMNILRKLKGRMESFEKVGDADFKFLENQESIEIANDIIKNSSESLHQVEKYKENVTNFMFPLMDQIRNSCANNNNEFAQSSVTLLQFHEWKVNEFLQYFSSQLDEWSKGFKGEAFFKETVNKLKEAIKGIMRMHSLIEQYKKDLRKAEDLDDPNIAPFRMTYTDNVELSMALAELIHLHYENDLLDDHKKCIKSFESYHQNLSFYAWTFGMHSVDRKEMLEGNEVDLYADIFSKKEYNAMNFSNIGVRISFAILNDTKIPELKALSVNLTHKGDSHYRCDNKVFVNSSRAYTFDDAYLKLDKKHSEIEKYHYGEFVIIEIVSLHNGYSAGSGDYVLSPYASWTIQLKNIQKNSDLTELIKRSRIIKIELVGEGQYINHNLTLCEKNLKVYYGKETLF